ncbi:Glycosyltransferase involved in cell wall bisynthesis [Microbacterium sp. cf046]|uniref:glycosyltransferase family A protein n=1 Tax=Microbacterium sp. cf046 TaxID=1761803 RepID=UPI0008E0A1C9|nr:glycosyltransferase family A protein [Microbacterium sp. cf046]SFR90833.1 Glycosyltransferase involved in cell wall bisynthesis [Microbacterium sp. cf046]
MTAADPLVSVIVATNRVSRFLPEALESVIHQTYAQLELVIVDDGSPDARAVERAAGSVAGARTIRIAASGVSVARNVGVGMTSGAYLVFLDDDDRWLPDRLAAQVAALEAAQDAVASYCGMQVIDASGRVVVRADQWQVDGPLDIARGQGGILLPNLMIRRSEFLAVGGFHSRMRQAEDLDLTLRLAGRGPFVFVDRTLTEYRTHEENTTKRTRELVGSIRRIVELHRSDARARGDQPLADALTERLRHNERYAWWRATGSARRSLARGDVRGAASAIWWALRTQPRGLPGGVQSRLGRRFSRRARPRH